MKKRITDLEFNNHLIQILKEIRASELLYIEGIYEILSEEFNNEVIERWEAEHETDR